jgi:hypothetical protein
VRDSVTFPLAFRLYKPRRRLKPGDVYKSKPQLAVELIQELTALGFSFSVVLARRARQSGRRELGVHPCLASFGLAVCGDVVMW